MSASDLVAQLAAAGTPPDLLAAVAKELFTAEAERAALSEIRKNARERKARSRDITGQGVTERDVPTKPLSRPPNEINSNPPTHTPGDIPRARKRFPIPEGVTAEQWTAFCGQRKKKLSEHAYGLLCGKLENLARDGWPPGEMIDLAIERGWETVFAPKEPRNDNRTANSDDRKSGANRPSGRDGFLNALREAADRQAADPAARNH